MKLEEFKQILELHTKWLKSKGREGKRAYLRGVDLQMHELPGVDLSHAILSGANFQRANLSGARFFGSDLRDANFSYANLTKSRFQSANLSGVIAVGAEMADANFNKTLLGRASFDNARCPKASFRGAMGKQAHFNRCDLTHADFDEIEFEDAEFMFSDLSFASFRNARLSGGSLTGALLRDIKLNGSIIEGVTVDENATAFRPPDDEILLDRRQFQLALHLHMLGKNVGEIAHELYLPRLTIASNLEKLKKEQAKRRITALRRPIYLLLAISLIVLIVAGLLDFWLTLFKGQPTGVSFALYALWLFLAVLSAGAIIVTHLMTSRWSLSPPSNSHTVSGTMVKGNLEPVMVRGDESETSEASPQDNGMTQRQKVG